MQNKFLNFSKSVVNFSCFDQTMYHAGRGEFDNVCAPAVSLIAELVSRVNQQTFVISSYSGS